MARPQPAPGHPAVEETLRENRALRRLVAVFSHLTGLVSQDADMDGLVRLVAKQVDAEVVLLGRDAEVLALAAAPAGQGPTWRGVPRLSRVLTATAATRRPIALPSSSGGGSPGPDATSVVAPVVVGDEVPAFLVTTVCAEDRSDFADLHLLLTEHAATVCGIILGRERVVAAAAGRARSDLIEGLLLARDHTDGRAERWASHLGFVAGRPYHVVSVVPTPRPPSTRELAVLEHALALRSPTAIVAARDDEVVGVVPVRESGAAALAELRALGEHCARTLVERCPEAVAMVGVGGLCAHPTEIARSYTQARSALDSATRMGPRATGGRVVCFEDLGIQRLLLQVPDLSRLRGFAVEVLGPLLDSEHDPRGDLLATLRTYFTCNASPQRTARQLHVHANTVAYRVRRVEEITALRLDHYRDRLMLQVACEIVESMGEGS